MSGAEGVRLHLFHASAVSVILREGPGALWRIILWLRDAGTFTLGDWARFTLDPERAALSPDGQHFLFFAVDGQWDRPAKGAYTAICKPPSFKPVALFPQGDTFGGGGHWVDNQRYVIRAGHAVEDIVREAPDLIRADTEIRRSIFARGVRKRARALEAFAPPEVSVSTEGARLLDPQGRVLADFSDMALPA